MLKPFLLPFLSVLMLTTGCTIKESNGEAQSSATEQLCIAAIQQQTSEDAEVTRDSETSLTVGESTTHTGIYTVKQQGESRKATCKVSGKEGEQKTEVTLE